MGKKKKLPPKAAPGAGQGTGAASGGEAVLPKVPEKLASPFKDALTGLKKELEAREKQAAEQAKAKKAAPPPVVLPQKRKKGLPEDDAMALSLAMQGVKRLEDKGPQRIAATAPRLASRTAETVPFGESAEERARARLAALVAQDVRFRIERDVDYVTGSRMDADARVVRELRRRRPSESLDLHGKTQREASEAIASFVRRCHQKGIDILCIVHGKGSHSDAGLGVLRDVTVHTLTETGIAPLVRAFVSAPDALGGSGALLVELLTRR